MAKTANFDLTDRVFKTDPYPFYARWRAESPVFSTILAKKHTLWLVSRYDDVVSVLKDEARFGKDRTKALTPEQLKAFPWVPKVFEPLERNMLDLDDDDHARLRSLVHQAFTPRLIENMRERVQALTNRLFDAVERRGRMDLIRDYALPLPATIIAEILGVPARDQNRFHRWSNAMLTSPPTKWGMIKLIPHVMAFMRYGRKLVRARRQAPRDDLITALVQAQEAGDHLSDDEMLAMIVLLLVAGHETTVNLIGNGLLVLMDHPDQMERLRDEPALMKPAVEELLRFDAPVQMATERWTREDVTVAGVTIPRGHQVFAVLGSANRDESQFDRPDELDLSREPNRHVSFGVGVHYCLGGALARLEGQIALATLLRRAQGFRLAVPRQKLRYRPSLILRGLESMPLEFSLRRAPGLQVVTQAR